MNLAVCPGFIPAEVAMSFNFTSDLVRRKDRSSHPRSTSLCWYMDRPLSRRKSCREIVRVEGLMNLAVCPAFIPTEVAMSFNCASDLVGWRKNGGRDDGRKG